QGGPAGGSGGAAGSAPDAGAGGARFLRARVRSRRRSGTDAAPADRAPVLRLAAPDERADRRPRLAARAGVAPAGDRGGGPAGDRPADAGGWLALLGEVRAAVAGRRRRGDGARPFAARDQCAAAIRGGGARAEGVARSARPHQAQITQLNPPPRQRVASGVVFARHSESAVSFLTVPRKGELTYASFSRETVRSVHRTGFRCWPCARGVLRAARSASFGARRRGAGDRQRRDLQVAGSLAVELVLGPGRLWGRRPRAPARWR